MSPSRPPCGQRCGVHFDRQFKSGKWPVGLWLKAASGTENGGSWKPRTGFILFASGNHCLDGRDFPVNQFFRQYQCQRTVAVGKMKQRRIFLRQGFVRVEILKASADTKVNKKFDGP